LRKAFAGNSRTAGVKAFCLHCVGYVRKDVRECSAPACPLFDYRPYQTSDEDDTDSQENPT
jgi:hypothetical protein